MDDMDESKRFDIETVEYDKDGIPVIPRISFSVPRSYRAQFLQDMIDEVRSTPGEQLQAIFVKYMRMRRAELAASVIAQPGVDQRRIPYYGPKVLPNKVELNKQDKTGA